MGAINVRTVPPVTRAACVAVLALFAVAVLAQYRNRAADVPGVGLLSLLAVVPAVPLTLLWTWFTAGFLELEPVNLVVNGASFLLASKYLEQTWSSRELVKFMAVTNAAVFGGLLATVYLRALVFDAPFDGVVLHGLFGMLCAFAVAFKQAVPEHTVQILGVVSVRVKHLPSIINVANALLFACGLVFHSFFMGLYGTIGAWVYIRFFRVQDGMRGDRSETFAFASFFPDAAHPFVKPVSNTVYGALVTIRNVSSSAPSSGLGGGAVIFDMEAGKLQHLKPLVSSDAAEAERRRNLALKTLDTRLQMGAVLEPADEQKTADIAAPEESAEAAEKTVVAIENAESAQTLSGASSAEALN